MVPSAIARLVTYFGVPVWHCSQRNDTTEPDISTRDTTSPSTVSQTRTPQTFKKGLPGTRTLNQAHGSARGRAPDTEEEQKGKE